MKKLTTEARKQIITGAFTTHPDEATPLDKFFKRTFLRQTGRTTTADDVDFGVFDPNEFRLVGWAANWQTDWAIYTLSNADREFLVDGGITDLSGVMRTATSNGTNIARFNLIGGTYAFLKDEDENGLLKFDKMEPYNRLFIDDQRDIKEFGNFSRIN